MNNWTIAGRVGNDAEHRYIGSGESIVNFSVAIDNGKDRDTNEQRKPTWVRVAMWGKRWEKLAQYITKGKFVVVSGRASLGKPYEIREGGGTRQDLIMTAYDFTFGGGGERQNNDNGGQQQQREQLPADQTTTEISDEDIPF
jgi:single-strand DNA-binding protein